ncbi:MAG: RecX family transcriptional regulator [Actinomycetota bacterium]|nr:RecX family transcriptional regulator [Actinomycetota bacterium]
MSHYGASEEQRALALAQTALSARDRTESELRSILERKRVEPEAIDYAVDELKAAGLLDDARFAQCFAEDKRVLERWGPERIERELRRRGVPAELVEGAMRERERGQELSAALELLAERMPQPAASDRERDRAWRLLVRKGYDTELAYEAVRAHGRREAA